MLVAMLGVACGGSNKQVAGSDHPFDCRARTASYVALKDISGDQHGVQIDCADAGPRIKRWKGDPASSNQADGRALSPAEFDKLWAEIDGTGWQNIKDCTNGTLLAHDPIYKFDIADDQDKASFKCQTHDVPYPYFDITNALDLAAQQGRGQLGDDDPADAKGKPK
jgi:hypothetical protein